MTRDERALDDAIDAVSRRMVDVPDDADLARRIEQSLPDRESTARWLMPRLALVSAAAVALVVWTTRERPVPTLPVLPSIAVNPLAPPVALVPSAAAREPAPAPEPEPARTPLLVLVEPLEHVEPWGASDHERSLPPIAGPAAIPMSELATTTLPATPSLVLAPIEIADLPMTTESFISRQ